MKPRKTRNRNGFPKIKRMLDSDGQLLMRTNRSSEKPPINKNLALSRFFQSLKGTKARVYLKQLFIEALQKRFSVYLGPRSDLAFKALEQPTPNGENSFTVKIGIGEVGEKFEPFVDIKFRLVERENIFIEDVKPI